MNAFTSTIAEDPFHLLTRLARVVKTNWLRWTYPFFAFGQRVSIDASCDIPRPMSPGISIGDDVYMAKGVWLTVIGGTQSQNRPQLVIGDRCSVGKRTNISASNQVLIEPAVLIGPSVVIMDYNHEFSDPKMPILDQGITSDGRVIIERNCWIGQGAAILSGRRELTIGRNSVVGANAVVTRSFPAYSVIAGNPARLIRRYDPETEVWVRAASAEPELTHCAS